MIFLRFGTELINLSQVYQIDLREADNGIVIAFFYHLAGSTSGGYKVSRVFKNVDEALNALVSYGIQSYGIQVNPMEIEDKYYDASQVPTGRVNTRIEPTRRRK